MCKKQESWFDRWLFWIYGQKMRRVSPMDLEMKDMYS